MPLSIPRDRVIANRLGGPPYSEWGPDLALLEIPPHLVATIKTRKSFLNLAKRRAMLSAYPPRIEKTLWAVMGMVAETSEVKSRTESGLVPVNIRGEAFFGITCTADRRRGYDYLTTYAKTTLSSVPTSFKGVSGGGLWQIGLTHEEGYRRHLVGRGASFPRSSLLGGAEATRSGCASLPRPEEHLPEGVGSLGLVSGPATARR
jgi:hypothetical protein